MTTWSDVIGCEKTKDYFCKTTAYVEAQRHQGKTIYPPACDVFNAFRYTAFDAVKVVIIGQDPYHGVGQAHGLCFSVQQPVAPPPSLLNIFKELETDISGFTRPKHGCLTTWAKQGVLLLNTVLTVEAGKAHSHAHLGWSEFTDCVIRQLSTHKKGLVFLLWGSHAQKKAQLIDTQNHHILKAPHPSPLSAHRGFFGCGHFSQCNDLLRQMGHSPIEWHVPA